MPVLLSPLLHSVSNDESEDVMWMFDRKVGKAAKAERKAESRKRCKKRRMPQSWRGCGL